MNERIVRALEAWFEGEQRPLPWREEYDPYEVWVSEVMAQQTRMEVVLRYWDRFLERFPSIHALAAAAEDDVLAAWSGLGYYRRARMLHAAAREIVDRWDGVIPSDAVELESVRGIGPYTAGAVSSIAFDERAAIVDGNVTRVLSRVYRFESRLGSSQLQNECWSGSRELVQLADSPRQFNQALMELGASVCTPRKPLCSQCPIRDDCGAAAAGSPEAYPRARTQRATVDLTIPVYLVRDGEGRVLLLRESGGSLLERMFRLPGDDPNLRAALPLRHLRKGSRLGTVRHTITHRRIVFEVWDARLAAAPSYGEEDLRWVTPSSLDDVPHPSWVRKAIALGGGA